MSFNLLVYPMYFIMAVSAVIALILALVNKILVDQDRMKEIQNEVKDFNKKMMKASKEKDQQTLDKLGKDKAKVMQLQSEMFKMQLPIFASILPFFVVFALMRSLATSQQWGEFMQLPFNVPILSIGTSLTWLGWYIICSLPFTVLFRKSLGVR